MKIDSNNRKYVFVGGLHRCGTSVLAFNIGRMENCTAFENTGVGMDEGQFLQDVYPIDAVYGGAGRIAFHPEAHLTEESKLLTAENVKRLRASWDPWWDESKSICVEKTPRNILMTRFLQAAFGNTSFIIIRRHPVACSLATQKWSQTSLHDLFAHWLRCHEIFAEDKPHLRQVYELTYEDYLVNQNRHHQQIAALIGAGASTDLEPSADTYNKKYFDRWHRMLSVGLARGYYRYIAAKFEPRFAAYNYSLVADIENGAQLLRQGAAIPKSVGEFYCLCAEAITFVWRVYHICRQFVRKCLRIKDEVNRIHRQGERISGQDAQAR